VSTTIGAIINSNAPQRVVKAVAMSLRDVLAHYCHTPKPGWWFGDDWENKEEFEFDAALGFMYNEWPPHLRESSKQEARKDFSKLCTALDLSLAGIAYKADVGGPAVDFQEIQKPNLLLTLVKLLHLIMYPSLPIDLTREFLTQTGGRLGATAAIAFSAAQAAAIVKYLSRYMSEHALMIASFFRVNAKRLRASEPLMLNIQDFARQCKEDIADGPGPAVPPPPEVHLSPLLVEELKRRDAAAKKERDDEALDDYLMYNSTLASCD